MARVQTQCIWMYRSGSISQCFFLTMVSSWTQKIAITVRQPKFLVHLTE